jgi:hypothetical protein
MSNEDYQRGYNAGQFSATPIDTDAAIDGFAFLFRVSIWPAAFLSVAWFWGFYPMVAALAVAFAAKNVWPERFWDHGRKWLLLAAIGVLPYLGHAVFGIPVWQQTGTAVHGQPVAGKGEK